MYEERIAYLCQIAKKPQTSGYPVLRSSYLLRCQDITKNCGLPEKHFSVHKRCSYCLLEWKSGQFETKIKPLRHSKKQRRKRKQNDNASKNIIQKYNVMERKCLFCNKISSINLPKPQDLNFEQRNINKIKKRPKKVNLKTLNVAPFIVKEKECVNVYSNAREVFALKNKNNTIESTEKVTPKVIKNNKRKKDRFAGLCKAAVIASAKLTQKEATQTNKLNLFLRKSK